MLGKLLSLVALAATALADGAAIVAAMDHIAADTVKLNDTVAAWPGDFLGALPITVESVSLLKGINDAKTVASESANLTFTEAIQIAQSTLALASSVNSTLETIIAAKHKFDHLLLSPIILVNLELEKKATDEFSGELIAKVPEVLQSTAKTLVLQIDTSFDKAIGVYNPFD